MDKKTNGWIKTTCPYCGVGCGVEAKPNAKGALDIRGDQSHPANYGKLCSKGLALGETVGAQGRLLRPSIEGEPASWDQALDHVANQFSEVIRRHGKQAVAFYVSGQLLIEDYYVANKLMKGFIGTGNIDTNSRLCMSSSVAGHQRAFGADLVPGCYEDIELADLVVLTGSNLAWCHPVLFQRLRAAQATRNTKVVVIDPRKTASCDIADLHLPLKPGSDIALFNGLLAYLNKHQHLNDRYITEHTEGFCQALATASDFANLYTIAAATGLAISDIEAFYRLFARHPRTVTVYSQGINQSSSGTDKVNSIINCHLATGRIGQPGSGPFSVTGQPNAMGGREVGGLATMLAAHMTFDNPHHHQLISQFWHTNKLADTPGLKAIDMFDAIEKGTIKAIWIMATNPAVTLPVSRKINKILENCPFVVVSDCMAKTDTLRHANVALPAQGWSEKSGTVTNSERRISRQRRILPSPGEAKPDWWMICEVAKRMGYAEAFNYRHEGEIFSEYATMTTLGREAGHHNGRLPSSPDRPPATPRPLNLAGLVNLNHSQYQQLLPQQWPVYQCDQPTSRLLKDGRFATASGKARFIPTTHHQPASTPNRQFSLILNTGRLRDHWHTLTRTGLSPRLSEHISEPFITLHPLDTARYGLDNGQLAQVSSRYGQVRLRVRISHDTPQGQAFAPFHWSDSTTSLGNINSLIGAHRDPLSGQPEFKCTPINIRPLVRKSEALLTTRSIITKERFARYAINSWTVQRITHGYLYRISSGQAPCWLSQKLQQLLAFHETAHYKTTEHHDELSPQNQHSPTQTIMIENHTEYRVVYLEALRIQAAFVVSPAEPNLEKDYIYTLLTRSLNDPLVQSLFTGRSSPDIQAGRTVCSCKNVGHHTITRAIRTHKLHSVTGISRCTLAGTGCGSCLPELQQLLEDTFIPQE
ncbi:nitrate reductase [Photobacterium aquae]|uniref:Nitrate reductase n=1 Tax=Photobacterium aquae TaxID=1195763 RepID=A0A0J1GYR5_9GAMM|nr:nitrate reductase [Photobacterium aquae]KLV04629.1 nitrate reductase [Photobacterium aquae]